MPRRADTASVDAAHDRRRHLGQILVEEGLVTAEALAQGLELQATTQRPLGELMVELGFVSPGAVANALAEQHGGLLRTEYGISAGLRPQLQVVEPEQLESEQDLLKPWRAAVAERDRMIGALAAQVRERDAELARLREEAVARPPEHHTDELETITARLAEVAAELERSSAQLRDRDVQVAELQAALAAAGSSADELAMLRSQAAAAEDAIQADRQAKAAELEMSARRAAEAEVAAAGVQAQLEGSQAELGALRSRLAAAKGELAKTAEELAEALAPPAAEPADSGPHVLFVPRKDCYELVERDGPAPAPGEMVQLELAYMVVRLGPSPLPGDRRQTCAYLRLC